MPTAIEFEHVSKQYRLGLVSTKTLSHDIRRFWITNVLGKEDPYLKIGETNDRAKKGSSEYVWALRDIDFKVEQGDVVGIIGKNGAGKSTLLKLLSRVTGPTTGTIRAHGRIGSLLEVGTGFHGEMTGRENIFMNGAILGMTKAEIDRKLDEIIDFSGCERYIDTPVKRYSSGMTVRLGFAVAAFLDPEILVVDEVLAVGDLEFQDKAIGKMKDVSQGEGRTVLFVSHNMTSIKRLCTKGVVLKNGMVDYMGDIQSCVDRYVSGNEEYANTHALIGPNDHADKGVFRHDVEFQEISMITDHPNEMATDEPLEFDIIFKHKVLSTDKFQCNVIISNAEGLRLAFYVSDVVKIPVGKDTFTMHVSIPNPGLPRGRYMVRFEAGIQDHNKGTYPYDHLYDVISFEIKYIHKDKKDEYLFWDASWGLRIHDNKEITTSIVG